MDIVELTWSPTYLDLIDDTKVPRGYDESNAVSIRLVCLAVLIVFYWFAKWRMGRVERWRIRGNKNGQILLTLWAAFWILSVFNCLFINAFTVPDAKFGMALITIGLAIAIAQRCANRIEDIGLLAGAIVFLQLDVLFKLTGQLAR